MIDSERFRSSNEDRYLALFRHSDGALFDLRVVIVEKQKPEVEKDQNEVNHHGDLVIQHDAHDEEHGDHKQVEDDQLLVSRVGSIDDEGGHEERRTNENVQLNGGEVEMAGQEDEVGGRVDADQSDDRKLDVVDECELGLKIKHLRPLILFR